MNTRYNALFISPRIRDVIDLLIANDYLDSIGGSYDRIGNGRRNHTSRIRASDKLCEAFEGLTIEPYQLSLNHKQECIVLTKDDTDEEGEKKDEEMKDEESKTNKEVMEDDGFETVQDNKRRRK